MDPVTEPAPCASTYPVVDGLGDVVLRWAEAAPDANCLTVAHSRSWSRADLLAQSSAVQAGLRRLSVGAGDQVALMGQNSLELAAALLAVPAMGAVAVPINTGLVGDGLAYVLTHSGAKVLVVDADLAERALAHTTGLDAQHVVVIGGSGVPGTTAWASAFPPTEVAFVSIGSGDDPAYNIYTSGTTGTAKGVLLSHRTVLLGAAACAGVMFEAEASDVIYTSLPFFHCAALQLGLWTSWMSGAHLVFEPRFSASTFWATMREYRVTAFHFIGPLMTLLWMRGPSDGDRAHSVRLAVGGGPRSVWTEFEERHGVKIVEMFGMTETFGGCIGHRPGLGKPWTVGKPLAHVELKIVDSEGSELPALEPGELLIRGRSPGALMSGYFHDPARTATAMDGGWYHTGDLCSLDADGFLRFHSRLRDIIRHRGENVSAVEIENVVNRHPHVAESAAVAVPSEIYEEDILLAVVPSTADIDVPAIVQAAAEHLPPFALPRFVCVVDELPKTATARVQKHLLAGLRDAAWDRLAVEPASP